MIDKTLFKPPLHYDAILSGMGRLSTELGPGAVRRHNCTANYAIESVDSRHCALQQVRL